MLHWVLIYVCTHLFIFVVVKINITDLILGQLKIVYRKPTLGGYGMGRLKRLVKIKTILIFIGVYGNPI